MEIGLNYYITDIYSQKSLTANKFKICLDERNAKNEAMQTWIFDGEQILLKNTNYALQINNINKGAGLILREKSSIDGQTWKFNSNKIINLLNNLVVTVLDNDDLRMYKNNNEKKQKWVFFPINLDGMDIDFGDENNSNYIIDKSSGFKLTAAYAGVGSPIYLSDKNELHQKWIYDDGSFVLLGTDLALAINEDYKEGSCLILWKKSQKIQRWDVNNENKYNIDDYLLSVVNNYIYVLRKNEDINQIWNIISVTEEDTCDDYIILFNKQF